MIDREDTNLSLGEILHWRREELGFTREDLAAEVGAATSYIQALEDNDYAKFPAKIYALGFYKKIIAALDLGTNYEELMLRFQQTWSNDFSADIADKQMAKRIVTRPTFLSMLRISILGGGLVLTIFLLILGVRLYRFIVPPSISIQEPNDKYFSEDNQVTVRGSTQQESSLTINGREINVDGAGIFNEKIELPTGFNKLEFSSENKFGKMNKAVRYVVVR